MTQFHRPERFTLSNFDPADQLIFSDSDGMDIHNAPRSAAFDAAINR